MQQYITVPCNFAISTVNYFVLKVKVMNRYISKRNSTLLVGEGDFSFSVCLASYFQSAKKMVATSLDSKGTLMAKYSMASSNLKKLAEMGCTIIHEVDARKMNMHPLLSHRRFDRIVFNFPHAGYKSMSEYNPRQIRLHQTLMSGFFKRAHDILKKKGKVYVTHKTSNPYSKWDIEELANNAGLSLFEKSPFEISDYPGYINKRSGGPRSNRTFPVGDCRLYIFAAKN